MTFLLTKTSGDENKADAKVGDKISFNLSIWFPDVSTALKVEIYTENNNSAVLSICTPAVTHVGRNFGGLSPPGIIAKKSAEAGDWKVGLNN